MFERKNNRIKAVLFDMDDTLIDWSGVQVNMADVETRHMQKVHTYLAESGYELPPFADFWGNFRETLINAWAEAKKDWSGVSFVKEMQTFLLNSGLDEATLDYRHCAARL